MLALSGGLLLWRLYQIRDLAFPAWVDSVHHALIIRKMLETGRVPLNLSPYLDVPFFYHFAFHGLTSLLIAITGLSIAQAILLMGQVLQVGVILSVYRLGRVLWPERLWAMIATALVAFVAQMPTYYTTWGKYPLLTATVLLPLAMSITLEVLRGGGSWGWVFSLALVVAATIIAHYFATLLLGLFIGIAVGEAILWHKTARSADTHDRRWLHVIAGAGLGILLTLPWIWWVWQHGGRFLQLQVGEEVLAPDTTYFPGYLAYLWDLLGPDRNRLLLALALPGMGLALRRRLLRSVAFWLILLLILANPWGWRLHPFSPDRVLLLLFLPASFLATETLRAAAALLARWNLKSLSANKASQVVLVGVAVWSLWGIVETRNLVPESAILATEADVRAMTWVQNHVPTQARFFIGLATWPPYGYRGVDGGWWLLPITGRQTLLPPAIYGLGDSREVERLNEMARKASAIAGCGPDFWDLVEQERLTHVYFNTQRSPIRPQSFDGCPAVERVYARDGVFIYRLLWPPQEWRSEGSGNGQFNAPAGVAVDAKGNVYMVDSDNYRIQKFWGGQ